MLGSVLIGRYFAGDDAPARDCAPLEGALPVLLPAAGLPPGRMRAGRRATR